MIHLAPYQVEIVNEGVDILRQFNILYLAMEVRTRKTATALSIVQESGFQRCLFVTKKKGNQIN